MLINRSVLVMGLCISTIFATEAAFSQNFPTKPIRIVTSLPGGGSDFMARMIAQGISSNLGQPIIVENRGGSIEAVTVAAATPDGYTLLVASGSFVLGPLFGEMQVDPIKDFSPVMELDSNPNILVVHPSVPATSVVELIALAKSKPGVLNYGSGSMGSSSHLAAELFKSMARVNIMQVPYKSAGTAVAAMLGGETQLMITGTVSALPHVHSGRLRGLAVTSPQPTPLAPGLPTIAASGLPGYEFSSFDAMFAPAKTPSAAINRVNIAISRFLKAQETREKLLTNGLEVVASSPEELGSKMKSELAKWGKLMRDIGMSAPGK